MKKLAVMLLAGVLAACAHSQKTEQKEEMLGGTTDAHGCLSAAGQSYSFLKKACVQVFDVADIKLTDPNNETLAVYAILSEDKSQAEVFGANLPENTVLDAVKGGYASKDGKTRLVKSKKGWKLRQ